MPEMKTDDATWQRLQELLEGFDEAMLVTHTPDGRMRARPMALAEARENGVLYFATAVDSPKVEELLADPRVAVCLHEGRRYVSITGTARVTDNRALIERLWSEAWKLWFPQGKDDPALCLLEIEPEEAEYWDQSGVKGLRYLFQAARAYVSGERMSSEAAEHGKVRS
jgi:general stress protein 26